MPDSGAANRSGWWLWSRNPLALILWPLSVLFCLLAGIRRGLYRRHWLASSKLSKPVVVVGNISVGGNGKTPVVHSLARLLLSKGYKAGILTRGYKSDVEGQIEILANGEIAQRAGDEANMLSELCACPIAVGADRVKSARALIDQYPELDVLLCDDGLQHYALARDMEIIVKRDKALGNGFCLPAGPLREPLGRLSECDLLISRDSDDLSESLGDCWNLVHPGETRPLTTFRETPVYALAGIGFPGLYFQQLRDSGLEIKGYAFADHHVFTAADLPADAHRPVLVTHKDAVKLRPFATENIWVVPLELTLSDDLQYRFLNILESKLHG